MAFRPKHSRGPERDPNEAVNPYAANNPTVVLPQAVRQDQDDVWGGMGQIEGGAPDVLERYPSPRQLPAHGTDDLWALNSAPPDRGEWQRGTSNSGQSDFLVFDTAAVPYVNIEGSSQPLQPVHPPTGQPLPQRTPSSAVSSGVWNAQSSGHTDPLRPISVALSVAIERQLLEQGESFPLERTTEHMEQIRHIAFAMLRRERTYLEAIPDAAEAERLIAAIFDETMGYGPLDPLLRDESVSEILVTGPRMTYVEHGGRLYEVPIHFEDDAHLLRIITKILRPMGVMVSEDSPIADVRLPDGTRVNVVIPPSALSGPTLTIRRAVRRVFTLEQMVRMDVLSLHMADFLRLCVKARLNVLISGGPGAGKTTLLNGLATTIDDMERIVKIEDTAELQLHQRHIVPLEIMPQRADGSRGVGARELVRNALRMRTERLLLGETRGAEAFDLVQAMNTGYDGSMTTIYANSPRDALQRLEALCMIAGVVLSSAAIRQQIATGVDLVIHCARMRDGSRRITHITDVVGMDGDSLVTADLFAFRETGLDMATGRLRGDFVASGIRATFASRLEESPAAIFSTPPYPRGM